MKEYLMDVHGFEEANMTILMDDGVHLDPTKDNILAAYEQIVLDSQDGDAVYCHYSGESSHDHGYLHQSDGWICHVDLYTCNICI